MGEAKRKKARAAGSTDDPNFQRSVFTQAFEQNCKLLDNPQVDDLRALIETHRGRNGMIDQAAQAYSARGHAECQIGCSSCCHQMVLCTPFEAFAIARYLLDTKTSAEIEIIRERLTNLAHLPLDPDVRYDAQRPCALLENNRCIVYEQRPSVCRTMLSASRAACEACLASRTGTIPYIADPTKIAAMMQLGIDYALITRRNFSTERVELSRALLIALSDFEAALTSWIAGQDPFPGSQIKRPGFPSNREMAETAAKRFGVV
jgi:Fe-S-cluster containining protein